MKGYLTKFQAQPKKSMTDKEAEAKYHRKLLVKAEIIVASASRLWGKWCRSARRLSRRLTSAWQNNNSDLTLKSICDGIRP